MIALDTNVLVRFLVAEEDAPGIVNEAYREQRLAARELVRGAIAAGESIFVGPVVLCEFVWVLRQGYGVAKGAVVEKLTELLEAADVVLGEREVVEPAVERYRRHGGDFADFVIRGQAERAGAGATYTFDVALWKQGFRAPGGSSG